MKIKSTKGLHIEKKKIAGILLDMYLFLRIFIVIQKY
jgi:hypothetical protein